MTTNTNAQIIKFWALVGAGKSAALDINTKTGEVAARYTQSAAGADGNGAAPATYGDDWTRIAHSDKGAVTQSGKTFSAA